MEDETPVTPQDAAAHRRLDLDAPSLGLRRTEQGVYVPEKDANDSISYPDDGHLRTARIQQESYWYRHRNNVILAMLEQAGRPELLVDVGGGTGTVSLALAEHGYRPILVEPGPGAVTAASLGVKEVVNSPLESVGFEPGSLAAVGIFDVLEHIEDDEEFLDSLQLRLRLGGTLVMTVPAHAYLWSNDDTAAGHFRRYGISGLRQQLNKHGFVVEFASYFFAFLVPAIFLMRTIPSKLKGRQKPLENTESDHVASPGAQSVIDRFCQWELDRIQAGKTIPGGSSIILTASRVE